MSINKQANGDYCSAIVPGRFPTLAAAEKAEATHYERLRKSLGREPNHRELLHGVVHYDPRTAGERLSDSQWQPVRTKSNREAETAANLASQVAQVHGIGQTTAEFRAETRRMAAAGELTIGGKPKTEAADVHPARQKAIEFVAAIEQEARYRPDWDGRHMEALRKLRAQAEQGDLDEFRRRAEAWSTDRDREDAERLAEYDRQISAINEAKKSRTRLEPLAPSEQVPSMREVLDMPADNPQKRELLVKHYGARNIGQPYPNWWMADGSQFDLQKEANRQFEGGNAN